MNSSTLRRLAADHAALQRRDLPPNYLFPLSESQSQIPDDLTQLTILLAGPQGTPYAQGLWKLHLKIPEDYPKNPPKASFRTRIWHPNVEESSGSVCVDTLKKDWESKLTLRDVLVTISCLLIHPNPDSALNAAAGQLLQEDYDTFARQAKLMTSIHASVPANLKEAAREARCRGESPGTIYQDVEDRRPTLKAKAVSAPTIVMKSLPERRIRTTRPAPTLQDAVYAHEVSDEQEDEAIASKENDPALSPSVVPPPSPRRPTLAKRPLSDLPCPTEADIEPCISPSQQNVINNTASTPSGPASNALNQYPQLTERNSMTNFGVRLAKDAFDEHSNDARSSKDADRPSKRVCSDEAKENIADDTLSTSTPELSKPITTSVKTQVTGRKTSTTSSSGTGSVRSGKPRVGLRRL